MVFISNRKLNVSAYSGHLQVLSKLEDGRYRPKHVVFSIANKHHHLAIYRVYENDWSGFEVDYIHKYGEQKYKH